MKFWGFVLMGYCWIVLLFCGEMIDRDFDFEDFEDYGGWFFIFYDEFVLGLGFVCQKSKIS